MKKPNLLEKCVSVCAINLHCLPIHHHTKEFKSRKVFSRRVKKTRLRFRKTSTLHGMHNNLSNHHFLSLRK
ncbi:unnamed protein product [Heterobilharzia americana]|nr:unnamed protein product [Heterobilharzia americana]